MLETAEPRYDVASLSLKTGRSVTHIYGRLRMAELIPEAADVFQANRITAGHAVLIARLPQEQQRQALTAAFREDGRSKEKQAVPVRELAQWIEDNLMLTLSDAVFDREDPDLCPPAGACTICPMRTGANTALFEDFVQDDRCLQASCFQQKVDAHIQRQKQDTEGLVQITRAYYTQTKSEEPVLTRNQYTVIEPRKDAHSPCSKTTSAIVVDGPGKRGELLQVCADPNCKVHGTPNYNAEQEAATRQRHEEWKAQEQERALNRERNRALLDVVLDRIPKVLTRDDYETLLFAIIEQLDYSDWEVLTERHKIGTDEVQEPDAAAIELRKKAATCTESQMIRMLFEIILLPSGYSEEPLDFTSPLASAARRYEPLPKKARHLKVKQPKAQTTTVSRQSRKPTAKKQGRKSVRVAAAHNRGTA